MNSIVNQTSKKLKEVIKNSGTSSRNNRAKFDVYRTEEFRNHAAYTSYTNGFSTDRKRQVADPDLSESSYAKT